MITAIDTNVLLDILIPNPEYFEESARGLEESSDAGSLVVCDIVYAELCCQFPGQGACDEFLASLGIRVQSLSREAHFLASRMWLRYRKLDGKRDRILSDFLVAGHAQLQANRLLTRDRGFYRSVSHELAIVNPIRPR